MTNLAICIDGLSAPQFPQHICEEDRQLILLALASAKQQIRPYDGKFEAHWLLTSFDAPVWETANQGREEMVDGKWENTVRIDWRVQLPNGALLTDARYELPLTLAKKIAFLARSGLISGDVAPRGWRNSTGALIRVIRWTVLHEGRFIPERYGLRLLDQPALEWLFGLLAEGGWAHALQIPQRLLTAIYFRAHGIAGPQSLIDSPYTVPTSELEPLLRWLEREDSYATVPRGRYYGKRYLRREPLAALIGESPGSFITDNVARFLRQFEPDFSNEALLVPLARPTEFPSQSTGSILESNKGTAGDGLVLKSSYVMATALDAHRHIPDLLPEPAHISLRRATSIAIRATRPSSHTLFMPINIGLHYLNTAVRFVHVYGQAIVGCYLSVLADYSPTKKNPAMNASFHRHQNDWRIATGEPLAALMNVTEFRREEAKPDFDRLRSNPTLDELLRVLIGSCVVCMALLKPSRESELTHLKRECLREYGGGYWMNFNVGKSNAGEAWQDENRPIPVITATAIHLLQRLGDGLSKQFGEDRKIRDNLFYLPKAEGLGVRNATGTLLNNHLDTFCDFVGLPTDSEGRRWYVRIHEMRKWFLLLLFWSGRFDVLDAARWIAGHTDAEHIYAYIEKEFPGEELPQLEAEYSIDRLYRREQERKRGERQKDNDEGIDALYDAVLRHFNVQSLTMVPESEWSNYVISMRKNEKFRLEPHSIFGEDGRDPVGIDVSFVMRDVD